MLGWWAGYGCRGSIFHSAVSKLIPFVDRTDYLLKMKQPLNAGQASSTTTLDPWGDDWVAILGEWNPQHKWNQLSRFVLSGEKVGAFVSSSLFQLPTLQLHQWWINGTLPEIPDTRASGLMMNILFFHFYFLGCRCLSPTYQMMFAVPDPCLLFLGVGVFV